MLDFKIYISALAGCLAIGGSVPYIRDIYLGKTKPHIFSWIIWFVVSALSCASQFVEHAGPGAFVTAAVSAGCLMVIILSALKTSIEITRGDCLCFCSALTAIPLWYLTGDPTLSTIVLVGVDIISFIPTFRKSYRAPHEETLSAYVIGATEFGLAIIALKSYSFATVLYPASVVTVNTLFVVMMCVRRSDWTWIRAESEALKQLPHSLTS